jgi:hypothetical protein
LNSSLWPGCLCLIPVSKATQTTFGPVGLFLSHSGVHSDHFWTGRAVSNSFRRRRVTQTTSGPVGLCLSQSSVDKATQTTFGAVGLFNYGVEGHPNQFGAVELSLPHFCVKGHPDHFQAGRAVFFSFRHQRAPRPPIFKKSFGAYVIRTHTTLTAQRLITLAVQTCGVMSLKV